jgi:replicative DNA helicase
MAEGMPPYDRAAERCVLGAMLRDKGALGDVLQIVRGDDFYADAHQKIFAALVELYDHGTAVEVGLLASLLRDKKHIDDIGGYPYLGELLDVSPAAANAVYYARIVRDKALLRRLAHFAQEIQRDAWSQVMPADELLEVAQKKLLDIAEVGIEGAVVTAAQMVNHLFDRLDAMRRGTPDANVVPTGYIDLDRQLGGGLHNEELIIIGARPGLGKTALALNIACNVFLKQTLAVFFASLEQSQIEIIDRLVCGLGKVNGHKLRSGLINPAELDNVQKAGEQIRPCPFFLDETAEQTVLRIAANARRLKLRHDIRLVVVDYLQLVAPDNPRTPRQEQVARISRRLKLLAREMALPVVALSQLNREADDKKEPTLANLRESGSIEQDADVVLLLHEPEDANGLVVVTVAKQRNGPQGDVQLVFRKDFMRFENWAPDLEAVQCGSE